MAVTAFTVGDARYFPGVVGLVNSLDVIGHTGEIVVLDCGFSAEQREALKVRCTLFPLPEADRVASSPHYNKLVAPGSWDFGPDDVAVIIDSDIVVTGSLDELTARAAEGELVAFADEQMPDRWFSEWQDLFELASQPRRQEYVNTGLVVFAPSAWPELIKRWRQLCVLVAAHPMVGYGGAFTDPLAFGDQDALNAALMTDYPAQVVYRPNKAKFPMIGALTKVFGGVKIVERSTLACSYAGQRCVALHSTGTPKPWQSLRAIRRTAYALLLRDMLNRPGLAIAVPPGTTPPWLRDDVGADIVLRARSIATLTRKLARLYYYGGRSALRIRTRLKLRH